VARPRGRRPVLPGHEAPAQPAARLHGAEGDGGPLDDGARADYHGYPWRINRLTYRPTNHRNIHVRGYKEEGTTTTPFDMVMLNDMDRFHLVMDVIDRVPGLGSRMAHLRQRMVDERLRHRAHTRATGEDLPDVRDAFPR
jgi:phosphoketolase